MVDGSDRELRRCDKGRSNAFCAVTVVMIIRDCDRDDRDGHLFLDIQWSIQFHYLVSLIRMIF